MNEEEGVDLEKGIALSNLHRQIKEHDATQMEFHLNSLWSAHYNLVRNYQEFTKVVEEYEVTGEERLDNYKEGDSNRFKIARKYTPEEASNFSFLSQSPNKDEEIFVFLRECIRVLANYATSANSLYQTAQNFRNEWAKEDTEDLYYERLNELEIGKKGTLVRDFRRYISHYRTIPLSVYDYRHHKQDTRNIRLTIKKEKLEEWGRLNKSSREYIEEMDTKGIHNDKIDIPWVIQQHKEAIDEFYNWFVEEMYESYVDEFEELEDLREEYNELAGLDGSSITSS